ncbi:hypothetical protein EYF80_023430 [Liparis tanakae]|uniref:Uncharacterized protein n=1 Tax=Liparis tanakae TaxID=230148 RepID=A0A4Z2HLJ3_9TELE|nr:hypothetical protein EYF80_023430 [Liparis tanakae]
MVALGVRSKNEAIIGAGCTAAASPGGNVCKIASLPAQPRLTVSLLTHGPGLMHMEEGKERKNRNNNYPRTCHPLSDPPGKRTPCHRLSSVCGNGERGGERHARSTISLSLALFVLWWHDMLPEGRRGQKEEEEEEEEGWSLFIRSACYRYEFVAVNTDHKKLKKEGPDF